MCGFAGVIAWDEKYRVRPETLARMSACIAHRGPDGEGTFLNHDAEISPDRPQVGMAFRRLAILDLDPRSNQPFVSPDGRYAMVFNGEIYNFRDLRKELEAALPGWPWRTSGDTEVLLASYAAWGEKCLEKLNGMFAVAIWDEREKSLFLSRDRMGQKPLYVAIADGGHAVAFASELPAVLQLEWIDRKINNRAIQKYLQYGYILRPSTVYRGVQKLPKGMFLRMNVGGSFEPDYYFRRRRFEHSVTVSSAEIRKSVEHAVQKQLISDVPIGCFLSGGIDSSVMALAMTRAAAEVRTFSVGFEDSRYDERPFAAAVAKYLGTKHHEFLVHPDAASDLPRLAAVFGEPFGDSSALPTHYLARETRRQVKVAISGDGGDELFGGYERYRAMALAERLPMRRQLAHLGKWLPMGHPKSRISRAARFLRTVDRPPAVRYLDYVSLFNADQLDGLLGTTEEERAHRAAVQKAIMIGQTVVDGVNSFPVEANAFSLPHVDPVLAARDMDLDGYLPDDLLTKVDRASMLHALEVRSPFMDHDLVQLASGLTTAQLLQGGPKRMLREAFAPDLPDFVFKRKKMGFAVPIGEWFRGELRSMLRDSLTASASFASSHFNMPVVLRLIEEHESGRVDHSQRLYALLMLELWWNIQRSS